MVGDPEDLLRALLHQDRRHALVADQAGERGEQLFDDDRREAFERLVEQHDFRIEHEGAPDRQHLLLAARELVAEIGPALGEAWKHAVDLVRRPRTRQRDRGQVFMHRERLEDVALLGHPADAGERALLRRQSGDVAPREHDGAAAVAGDADDGVDERGLAHAVAAEQRQRLALRQRERDVGKDHRLAIAGPQPLDAEKISHRRPRRDRPPARGDRAPPRRAYPRRTARH